MFKSFTYVETVFGSGFWRNLFRSSKTEYHYLLKDSDFEVPIVIIKKRDDDRPLLVDGLIRVAAEYEKRNLNVGANLLQYLIAKYQGIRNDLSDFKFHEFVKLHLESDKKAALILHKYSADIKKYMLLV